MKTAMPGRICLYLFLAFILVARHYTYQVSKARHNTSGIIDAYYEANMIKISSRDLSPRQLEILIKVEDPNFYHHHGVDFKTPGAGWTTITQGLAKKLYFADFKQGIMKIEQTLYAYFVIDPLVPKEKQIDLYLNLLYYGNGVYGLNDAAGYYYAKPVSELSEDEYISLIACLINPNDLNVKDHPLENKQRVQRIKKLLSGTYSPSGLFDITYDGADNVN